MRGDSPPSTPPHPQSPQHDGYTPSHRLGAGSSADGSMPPFEHIVLAAQRAVSGRGTPNSSATEPWQLQRPSSPTPSVSSVWSAASDFIGGGDRSFSMSGVWARRHRARADEMQRRQARELR